MGCVQCGTHAKQLGMELSSWTPLEETHRIFKMYFALSLHAWKRQNGQILDFTCLNIKKQLCIFSRLTVLVLFPVLSDTVQKNICYNQSLSVNYIINRSNSFALHLVLLICYRSITAGREAVKENCCHDNRSGSKHTSFYQGTLLEPHMIISNTS